MFDLNKDPRETTDILAQNPELAKEMKALWDEWNEPNIPYQYLEFFQYKVEQKKFHKAAMPPEAKKYLQKQQQNK